MNTIKTRHIWILSILLLTFLLPIHGHEVSVSSKSAAIGSSRELARSEIQYTDSTDYLLGGSLTLKNGCIDKLQFEGGYCQAAKYSATHDNFTFSYYDQDHLGSIRQVRIVMSQGKGPILQTMNYYPFGAQFCDGSASSSDVQSHKYNGKELDKMHGLNTYDHGARQYNPVTARWDRMDPLAEKYYSYSPYSYCMDNPINNIDPDGRAVETFWDAANVILDATSLVANAASGNLLSATVDAGALLVDAAATAVPFVPGGGEAAASSMATGRAAITFNSAAVSVFTSFFHGLGSSSNVTNYRAVGLKIGKIRIGGVVLNNFQEKVGLKLSGTIIPVPMGIVPTHGIEDFLKYKLPEPR